VRDISYHIPVSTASEAKQTNARLCSVGHLSTTINGVASNCTSRPLMLATFTLPCPFLLGLFQYLHHPALESAQSKVSVT